MSTSGLTRTTEGKKNQAAKAARASAIGTLLEWYDFGIYGIAAALVLNSQFFPNLDPAIGVLAAFASLAVGFVARPLGALLFGHLGDTWGRKNTLVLALLITGGVTVGIGLLPTYSTIGIAAPILLVALRFIQGIGVGGEWGGAVLLSTEHAPPGKRSFYGGLMAMGVPLGVALSNGVFLVVALFVPAEAFAEWGWRIPFLGSVVILAVGLWIRLGIDESPQFEQAKAHSASTGVVRVPLKQLFVQHYKSLVLGIVLGLGSAVVAYVYLAYVLSWGQKAMGFSNANMLGSVVVGSLIWAAMAPIWATIGDKSGGMRRIFLHGGLIRSICLIPFFGLLMTQNVALLYVAMAAMGAIIGMTQVPLGAVIASLFPVNVRYTGTSVTYNVASVIGGGFAPLVAATIAATSLGISGVIGYVVLVSLISTVGGLFLSKTGVHTPSAEDEEKQKEPAKASEAEMPS